VFAGARVDLGDVVEADHGNTLDAPRAMTAT
jgi:hypothetical protein